MERNGFGRMVALVGVVLALVSAGPARGTSLQEIARLQGQAESTVWGLGLVIGLNGTGDSGSVLPLARQVAALLEQGGNKIPNLDELAKARNVALVMVTATIPKSGALRGDKYDCHVQAYHSASSLAGGRLFITPLQGPLPGQGVFAMAEGPLSVDPTTPTVARVRRGAGSGAQIVQDIVMPVIAEDWTIGLVIEPSYAGWPTTRLVAGMINQFRQGFADDAKGIARAVDDRTVVVQIPVEERANPANFIGQLMASIQIDDSLLQLPARVIINEREGTIVMSGDVEISSALIAHKDMVITDITPPVEPSVARPDIRRTSWTEINRETSERRGARLDDLLRAMKQLDIPVEDQIAILTQLRKNGQLHAEIVIE